MRVHCAGEVCTATSMLDGRSRHGFRYLSEDGAWINDDEADGYATNGVRISPSSISR